MKELVIIDGQVFQSGAWHRGMGKYSFELLKEAVSKYKKKGTPIKLILNANLVIEDGALRAISKVVGKQDIEMLDLVRASRDASKDRFQNKKILNDYVRSSKSEGHVKFVILSLFLDNGVAVFPDVAAKFLLFYDAIPFLYPEKYKDRINYDNYLTHYSTVFEADKIFAISQTVADDVVLSFGIPASKVINIDGARIGTPQKVTTKPKKLDGINRFILSPTGDELRKNNLRAVQGFELFNQRNGNSHKLVLTSFFSEFTMQQLSAVSANVIFTQNISFEEMEWLYEHADAVLFPSEYEGLGLPILEAVTLNKKIACSNIPVFREISQNGFFFFDPLNPIDIAHKLAEACDDTSVVNAEEYEAISSKYSWERTSDIVVRVTEKTEAATNGNKPSLAICAPAPDGYSAIGKVVSESHATLSEHFDITYYFEKGLEHKYLRPDFLSKIAPNYSVQEFDKQAYELYDAVLYHIGNSEYHLSTIANALVYPGFCIFHDTNLGGAFGLLEETGFISPERYRLEQELDSVSGTTKGKFLGSVSSNQMAIFAHSNYALKAIKESAGHPQIVKLNLPVDLPALNIHQVSKDRPVRIGLAGILAGIKGIELVEELAQSQQGTGFDIKIFGYLQSEHIKNQLKRLINVSLATNPTDFEFQNMLAGLDILLNFRMRYQGETSLTVLEAMRYGVVVIVRDVGWYSELPDDAVVKVKTKKAAIAAVLKLSKDRAALEKISNEARNYIAKHHNRQAYAEEIAATVSAVLNNAGIEFPATKRSMLIRTGNPSKRDLSKIYSKSKGR